MKGLRKIVKTPTLLTVTLMGLAGLGLALSLVSSEANQPTSQTTKVRVAEVLDSAGQQSVVILGVASSGDSSSLSFQASGRVVKKLVREGSSIKPDQILAVLDNPDAEPNAQSAQQRYIAAKSGFIRAKADYERFKVLNEQQAITRQEWDQITNSFESARAEQQAALASQQRANQAFDELSLRAPFAGIVTAADFDIGDVIQAGQPVISVANPNVVEVLLTVSPNVLEKINIGDEVGVTRTLQPEVSASIGKVSHRSPFTERASLPQVIVTLDAAEIQPGMPVSVTFSVSSDRKVLLPIRSIIRTGENSAATYLVKDDLVYLKPVTPLQIIGESVAVDADIEVGSLVVTDGVAKLYDLAQVEVER